MTDARPRSFWGMNAHSFFAPPPPGFVTRMVLLLGIVLASACTPQATPTLFIPPTAAVIMLASAPPTTEMTATPLPTAQPSRTAPPPTPTPCVNDLSFGQDLTFPDGTTVAPGQSVDKQWLVSNIGTCNWDAGYRLKLITGELMGVTAEQALFPARAGTQTTLRIVFTAPQEAGSHEGAWQAFAPDGMAFGQPVYIKVDVAP